MGWLRAGSGRDTGRQNTHEGEQQPARTGKPKGRPKRKAEAVKCEVVFRVR